MTILCVGLDLAKNVFALHGANEAGKTELIRPAVPRDKLHEFIAGPPPCVISVEACSSAHHWARLFQALRQHRVPHRPESRPPRRLTGKLVSWIHCVHPDLPRRPLCGVDVG